MKKKKTLRSLKVKAWKLCSEYVRRRDADEGGFVGCYTCCVPIHWKYEAQAGHAIGGRRNAVLLDLELLRPQCYACNAKHIGNGRPEVFIPKLIREHGLGWWEEKAFRARQALKLTREDLENKIAEFQSHIQSLEALSA